MTKTLIVFLDNYSGTENIKMKNFITVNTLKI